MANQAEIFKDCPELAEAGKAFHTFLEGSGLSVRVGFIVRENAYPLLEIQSGGSSLEAIEERLHTRDNCSPELFSAFNLRACLCRHNDTTLLINGSPQIITDIASRLSEEIANTPAP